MAETTQINFPVVVQICGATGISPRLKHRHLARPNSCVRGKQFADQGLVAMFVCDFVEREQTGERLSRNPVGNRELASVIVITCLSQ